MCYAYVNVADVPFDFDWQNEIRCFDGLEAAVHKCLVEIQHESFKTLVVFFLLSNDNFVALGHLL